MMQAFFDAADGKKVIVVSDRPEYLCKRFGFIADYALYSKNCGLGQYNVVWDRQND